MEFAQIEGMKVFEVRDRSGMRIGYEVYAVLERAEKRTIDLSKNKWFPQVLVEQNTKLQRYGWDGSKIMETKGEPFWGWVLIPEESKALPFKGTTRKGDLCQKMQYWMQRLKRSKKPR